MKPRFCKPKRKITKNDKNKSVKGKQVGFKSVDLKNFKITPSNSNTSESVYKILTYIGIRPRIFKVLLN